MKKLNRLRASLILVIFVSLGQLSCVKTNNFKSRSGTLSFNLNHQSHSLTEANFTFGQNKLFITIDDPSIFQGTIYFSGSCGYFAPKDSALNIMVSSGCQISSNLSPIDSSLIYIYQSGQMIAQTDNCHNETGTDLLSGRTITATYCDVNGSFDLLLKNRENKTMSLTEGKFHISNN